MLPVAGPLPEGPGWAFEFSWDGIRCLASVAPERVSLFSSSHRSISATYPELTALARRRRMLLDGKIVALDSCGRPSLARLARRRNARPTSAVLRQIPVSYYVFDLLSVDGASTTGLPYRRRRELLADLELTGGPIVAPPCFLDTHGEVVLETAAAHGLPGVIAKRLDSTYRPGRSRSWVQTTLRQTQEVIIGGWVPERRDSTAVGALLVGVPTAAGLRYVGQVGTGFTDVARQQLCARLTELAAPVSPFAGEVAPEAGRVVHWVAPALLGEVSYRQWSAHGRLERPTWLGLRPARHVASIQAPVVLCAPDGGQPGADPALVAELESAVAQVRTELRTLRGQIAPHFVHNTISTIVALVSTDPSRARDLMIIFAEFARYSLRSATQTTLDAELENIERYLTLQQTRFGARLQIQLQVVPGALPVVLPFLALQQLVDNAVRGGIEPKQLGGTVTLSALLEGPDCLITVRDDGPGEADTELLATLRTIDGQLRDGFGERYGLVTEFIPGTGTTISLRVPAASR